MTEGGVGQLVRAAMNNRLLVVLGLLILIVVGARSLALLPIDAVPDVTNVQVQVLTRSPGLGPLEVERSVTTPVESAMGGLPRLEEMRSTSRFGLSAVTLVFEEGTDLWWARQLIGERLAEARDAIPPGVGEPELGPPATGLGEVFQFEVRGEGGTSMMDLRDVLEWQIAPVLRQVPGVVEVNTFGGELRTFTVEVDPDGLAARGVSLGDLYDALERNNRTVGGGVIERGPEQVLLRGVALLQSTNDIAAVSIRTAPDGTPITVADVATVHQAPMLRQGAMTRDGAREGVAGIAMMGIGENSRVVASSLRDAVAELQPTLPPGVRIDVFYDRTELVDRTIHTVARNLVEGGLLVFVVLLLLLGNARASVVVASAIPLSMLAAVIAMHAAGVSGNLMSLGAIDFGLIVDGSVVMIENMLRVVGERRERGEEVTHATWVGAAMEVARPVSFSVGIIILAYLPILSLTGVEGRMFRPMALTVVFALTGALVLAVVAMPVLASLVLRGARERKTRTMSLFERGYRPALAWALRRPKTLAAIAVNSFIAGLLLLPWMGAEFIPTLDEGAVGIEAIRQPSASVEEAVREARSLEAALLRAFPDEVDTVVSRTGAAEISTDPGGLEMSDVVVTLAPRDRWTRAADREELTAAMREVAEGSAPGMNLFFSQPIEQRTNELIEGVRADVAIVVHGDDLNTLVEVGARIGSVIRGVPGADAVKVERVAGLPVLTATVDPQRLSRLGLDATHALDAIEAVRGRDVGEVVQGRRRYPIQVRFPSSYRDDPDRLASVRVGREGFLVPLGNVARLEQAEGPLQISHEGGQRRLTVEVNVRDRDVASFVAEARRRLDAGVTLPPGYRLSWGGTFQNLAEAAARLAVVVPLILILIFVLLQANFRSARLTLLVYANVPLAVTGGIVALFVRGLPLSISAAVGFIALFGIAVMNGVVLVTCIRDLHEGGRSALDAARDGAQLRLRPVLMTALVAALGFLPMALATSPGAEVQRPLATVVIGGLVTSTLLTLLVLPALYAALLPDPDGGVP